MSNEDKKLSYVERRLTRMFGNPNTKHVIVCVEKHSTRYHDASTREVFLRSCLRILKERLEQPRYWYGESETREEFDSYMKEYGHRPSLTKEQAQALPEGGVKKKAIEELQYYADRLQNHLEHNQFLIDVQVAVSNEDGLMAWELLELRAKNEYERFQLEPLENS